MRAPLDRLLLLSIAGTLLACSDRAPGPGRAAPAAAEAAAEDPPPAPVPVRAPSRVASAATPEARIPAVSWPAGFAVTRSGTLGGPAAPAAWYEIRARGLGAAAAAQRTLDVLTGLAGKDSLSDLSVAEDGRSAVAQVRGPSLSAVIAASTSDGGATLRVTLEPRG